MRIGDTLGEFIEEGVNDSEGKIDNWDVGGLCANWSRADVREITHLSYTWHPVAKPEPAGGGRKEECIESRDRKRKQGDEVYW
jgi:hypothetical protein